MVGITIRRASDFRPDTRIDLRAVGPRIKEFRVVCAYYNNIIQCRTAATIPHTARAARAVTGRPAAACGPERRSRLGRVADKRAKDIKRKNEKKKKPNRTRYSRAHNNNNNDDNHDNDILSYATRTGGGGGPRNSIGVRASRKHDRSSTLRTTAVLWLRSSFRGKRSSTLRRYGFRLYIG